MKPAHTSRGITNAAGEHQPPLPSQIAHDFDHLDYRPPQTTSRPQPKLNYQRPYVRVFPKTWDAGKPTQTEGVALAHRSQIVAHLTPEEAFELANVLTDLAEQIQP